ncbi:prophage antirepressor [Bacillus phage vB_Bacillus_1020A]|uniref:Ltp family lipoprotein n=1 Tax=Robertmurraya sp. DFI.2.37 TaxID=3031819 RepID=UPI001860BE8C|nr:Ltp family lipoprotein [Robertmurraya sp. DFI.2.37]MDF1511059.1 Ltp family lipoprotein [Robertmurraya sp. DFI.2.37]QIW89327.1 prophage antirepressor [Bacillus phage vB_Bacillus_1020A]
MDLLLFILGMLLFVGSLVYLVIALIKKTLAKKRFFTLIASGVVLMLVGLFMTSPETENAEREPAEKATQINSKTEGFKKEPELTEEEKSELEKAEDEAIAKEESIPREHKSALTKAEQYAKTMYMSKSGIYDQLVSEYGENFPPDAAQYAIDNIEWDWKENALKKAEQYAETMSMSNQAIYDQLISEHGEKFAPEEAQYAIDNLE